MALHEWKTLHDWSDYSSGANEIQRRVSELSANMMEDPLGAADNVADWIKGELNHTYGLLDQVRDFENGIEEIVDAGYDAWSIHVENGSPVEKFRNLTSQIEDIADDLQVIYDERMPIMQARKEVAKKIDAIQSLLRAAKKWGAEMIEITGDIDRFQEEGAEEFGREFEDYSDDGEDDPELEIKSIVERAKGRIKYQGASFDEAVDAIETVLKAIKDEAPRILSGNLTEEVADVVKTSKDRDQIHRAINLYLDALGRLAGRGPQLYFHMELSTIALSGVFNEYIVESAQRRSQDIRNGIEALQDVQKEGAPFTEKNNMRNVVYYGIIAITDNIKALFKTLKDMQIEADRILVDEYNAGSDAAGNRLGL